MVRNYTLRISGNSLNSKQATRYLATCLFRGPRQFRASCSRKIPASRSNLAKYAFSFFQPVNSSRIDYIATFGRETASDPFGFLPTPLDFLWFSS
jgi:hypothetical protein